MRNSKSLTFAAILGALFSPAAQTEIVRSLPKSEPVRPRSNTFYHRSGEGPRETARRRKQIASGVLRISQESSRNG